MWWLTVTLLPTVLFARSAGAQTFFYNEVVRDGRIYVFATGSRYDAFVKSNGQETGKVIERPAYGPNGETVVFDSQTAINLYNFKHGLPGENFPETGESAPPAFPSHKFSGLMFGDYYWYYGRHQDDISSTNPTPVKGEHGLWFRRLYFTYDFAYSEKLSTRFRLEANSGDFEGGDIVPYVKDAYIKWVYKGRQQFTLGIQPTLTFDWLDGFWGLRHVEKTPADLYRIDSSRDFGFSFAGPARVDGLTYGVQFGNESGNGSETQEGKILRVESHYQPKSGLALEGFYSFGRRPSHGNHQTVQGVAGFQRDTLRAGAQYLWQQRQSPDPTAPDQTIGIWSGFGVWDVRPKKADLFLRADHVAGDLGGVRTGLPDAENIDYLLLSSQSPFSMWMAGGEWFLHPSVRFGPNLEIVRYSREPDPVQFPGRQTDGILRFTFYWTF